MRQFNKPVFDEVIFADPLSHSGNTYYTSCHFDDLLGQFDQLAIQAITDDTIGTATSVQLQVAIETSCDGRNWVQKSGIGPEINASLFLGATTLVPCGYDDGQHPSYAFVRLRINLSSSTNQVTVHLVIHVTGRDSGGVTVRAAARSMYQVIPGPVPSHMLTKKQKFEACVQAGYLPGDCHQDEGDSK